MQTPNVVSLEQVNDLSVDQAHWARIVERERQARKAAEEILEEKSRLLFLANEELNQLNADLESRVSDRTRELERARREALELSERDQLTGLANRTCYCRVLGESFEWGRQGGPGFGLLLLDLDKFKQVNDTLGHDAGDALLKTIAKRLQNEVRNADLVARLGGDEFAIVLREECTESRLAAIAGRIIEAVQGPISYDGNLLKASCSIGVACFPQNAATPHELQRNADMALYEAKSKGRGCWILYRQAMSAKLLERRAVAAELSQAIAQGHLEAWFQPKVDLRRNEVTGLEALCRWNHPGRGLLQPSGFIAHAEESNLIVDLSRFMLEDACTRVAKQCANEALSVSVNVSPRHLTDESFVSDIEQSIDKSGIAPDRLNLEVTENILLSDIDLANSCLKRVADLGVGVMLDDFGTGYSNLAYLHRLPINTLKIDRSFVTPLCDTQESTAIVRAVVELAHSLELNVVAEGVETIEHHRTLRMLGCDVGQGYLYAKPMPLKETLVFLDNPQALKF